MSVELYRNLEGKGAYLKAVSFLGAATPQVKGLEPIKFMESEADTYEFESGDESEEFTEADVEDLKIRLQLLKNKFPNSKKTTRKWKRSSL